MTGHPRTSLSSMVFPSLALLLAAAFAFDEARLMARVPDWIMHPVPLVSTGIMIGTVFASLVHAEVIAKRLGEPLGTLALTICVTAIEVTILVSLMLNEENNPTLARESIFSVVMIVCTGLVGLCLVIGALRQGEPTFQVQGANDFLVVLMALSVLTLILPDFTITTGEGTFSNSQLGLVTLLALALYSIFLFIQTVRHRGHFLDPKEAAEHEASRPSTRRALFALGWLIGGLTGIVLLAERVAANVETAMKVAGVAKPDTIIGALLATLVLMPEGLSAVRAANRGSLQTALNVALGSALATIGLTIPAVAIASIVTDHEIILGIEKRNVVLLALTLGLSTLTFGTGRTNLLTGFVHLVVFAAFVFLLLVP